MSRLARAGKAPSISRRCIGQLARRAGDGIGDEPRYERRLPAQCGNRR